MNPTIEKIINHLFEEVEQTEETRAIYEEIRTNCQERYEDMRERGLSEDEAIHAVMESLSGMEDMLKPYVQKEEEIPFIWHFNHTKPRAASDAGRAQGEAGDPEVPFFSYESEETQPDSWTFYPAQTPIGEIRLSRMASTDVTLCPSDDGQVHVQCDDPAQSISARMTDDALLIEPCDKEKEAASSRVEGLGGLFSGFFQHICSSFGGSCSLRVAVPAGLAPALYVDLASGDLELRGLSLSQAHLGSASGDIRLSGLSVHGALRVTTSSGDIQGENVTAHELSLTSTSGDVRMLQGTVAAQARMGTTSGDLTWDGDSPAVEATSISGDLRIDGAFEKLRFKTVSGDCLISVQEANLLELSGQTASGDIRLRLPASLRPCIGCRTTCGDIHQHVSSFADGAARVTLQTASGDISIR